MPILGKGITDFCYGIKFFSLTKYNFRYNFCHLCSHLGHVITFLRSFRSFKAKLHYCKGQAIFLLKLIFFQPGSCLIRLRVHFFPWKQWFHKIKKLRKLEIFKDHNILIMKGAQSATGNFDSHRCRLGSNDDFLIRHDHRSPKIPFVPFGVGEVGNVRI